VENDQQKRMAPELWFIVNNNPQSMVPVMEALGAMQPAQGWEGRAHRDRRAGLLFDRAANQKPGAELRPGANHQFQFRE
jgi:hypothetical protein